MFDDVQTHSTVVQSEIVASTALHVSLQLVGIVARVARLFRIGFVAVRTADALTEALKLVPTIKRRRSRKMNNDFAPKITNIAISERK